MEQDTHAVPWQDYRWPADRWPNFAPQELACKGTGLLLLDWQAMDRLQALRNRLGRPLIITSAYRSPQHNRAVGGATRSLHMRGTAFDVRMENHDPAAFIAAARAVGFTGIGTYPRSGFIHVDTGPARSWGDAWPPSAVPLAMPPARQPETLRENTEAQVAGGIVGVSSAVAIADQVTQDGGLLDRLANPTTALLLVALVGAWLFWREMKGRR